MIKSKESRDFETAFKLQEEINCFGLTENAILPKNKDKENYKPKTLIDQTLELIDPTPNIYTLFVQFNERFFSNVLLPVEVKWSSRMTSCAGICSFHPRNRQCVITLSVPLLKLRPRKDLVETLLHEMIHGFLFLTNNNRDRDGHGPEFCKHMNRINKAAGTKITIYHSFHDEVKLYQQHWWRCNGPCQKRAPYFGTVRRAMNRAPGKSDFWWKEHQQSCGGQFVKIKEPENYKTKASKTKEKTEKPILKTDNTTNNMFKWIAKTTSPIKGAELTFIPKKTELPANSQSSLNRFQKLGNNTNNVYGWGTAGPNSLNNTQRSNTTSVSSTPKSSTSGVLTPGHTLGGSNTGRSSLLSKFTTSNSHKPGTSVKKTIGSSTYTTKAHNPTINSKTLIESDLKLVECPICSNFEPHHDISKHIDSCLLKRRENMEKTEKDVTSKVNNINSSKLRGTNNSPAAQKRKSVINILSSKQPRLDSFVNSRKTNCPVCNKNIELSEINEHLDKCLSEIDKHDNSIVTLNDSICNDEMANDSEIFLGSTSSSNTSSCSISEESKGFDQASEEPQKNNKTETSHKCLVCNTFISPEISLNDHLEDCIGSVFNDNSTVLDSDNEQILENTTEISFIQDHKYPCPICIQLVPESIMNQHLDECLAST